MELLQQSDFSCIGNVAKHCDNEKMCIAENEAIIFDVAQLFCDTWDEIEQIFKEVNEGSLDADKLNLINGGVYLGCNGKNKKHNGVRDLLAYYSYSRYVIINGYSDTATGLKQKTDSFTIPIPLKELEQFADKYRNMGLTIFNQIENYLCKSKDIFTWHNGNCNCGCESGNCEGQTKNKGFGFKSSNITKNGLR